MPQTPLAFITGCEGPALTRRETAFFRESRPFGLILFERNCHDPQQISRLTDAFRECVENPDAPVLIDQEGGRVMRLKPPHWREYPPAALIGSLYRKNPENALEMARIFGRLLASELVPLGINVNCLPLVDVPVKDADGIIGARAFSDDSGQVAAMGRALMTGLMQAGCLPVIKHIPGHGRAGCDSHKDLPIVTASKEELRGSDFLPFKALSDCIFAMSAHVVYTSFDTKNAATVSKTVIRDVIRGEIGFSGLLMSDDLSMKALRGSMKERAGAMFAAGCDLALHCDGKFEEMQQIAAIAPKLGESALALYAKSLAACGSRVEVDDPARYRALVKEAVDHG